MKKIFQLAICSFAMFAMTSFANGDLVIRGVIDGDLSGGNPKAIVVEAVNDVADLSTFGVGSANNGGGSDGEEFTLSGSATAGDVIVVAGNSNSFDFFSNNYVGLTVFEDFAASINGDDAIELFQNGGVIDTYGDINTLGDGETWDYSDGFAVRIGGSAGAFDQNNYDSQFLGLENLDEAAHVSALSANFGFQTVPEPSSLGLLAIAGLGFLRRRRS